MLSRASRLTASIVTAYFVLDALDDYKRLSGVLFWRNLLKSKDRAKIVKQICKTAILRMRTRAEQSTGLNEPTADAGTDGGETSDAAPRRGAARTTENGFESEDGRDKDVPGVFSVAIVFHYSCCFRGNFRSSPAFPPGLLLPGRGPGGLKEEGLSRAALPQISEQFRDGQWRPLSPE